MALQSTDPYTGETWKTYSPLERRELHAKLELSREAFEDWKRRPLSARAQLLAELAGKLESRETEFAELMAREMGKPVSPGREEIRKCASVCRHYAETAPRLLRAQDVAGGAQGSRSQVRFDPIGPVLAVMPWNFPFWQVFRFAAPTLVAGNTGLLKHASNVPGCSLAIEEIFQAAGFPSGVFQALLVGSDQVPALIDDPRVAAVTLTGSEAAGRDVGSRAGRAIKRSVLELGGSDPFVVLGSADLELAATTAARARVINSGQSCIAAKRFIVVEEIAQQFEDRMAEAMRALKLGAPLDPATELGPLATASILNDVVRQVRESVKHGGRVVLGGSRWGNPAHFFEPTILSDTPLHSPVWTEEVFGPVAAIRRARDAEEALVLANSSRYGLGASVWSQDEREIERFVEELEAGLVFINGMVVSDPRLPFGGVKQSGYGRELGEFGIHEFVNIKTIVRR